MSLATFNTLDLQFDQACTRLGRLNTQLQAKGSAGSVTDCGTLLREVTRLLEACATLVQQMTDECKNHDAFQRKLLSDKVMGHRNLLRHHNQLQASRIRSQRLKEEMFDPSAILSQPKTPTGEEGGKLSYDDIKTALLSREAGEKEKQHLVAAREEFIRKEKKAEEKERRRLQRQQRSTL